MGVCFGGLASFFGIKIFGVKNLMRFFHAARPPRSLRSLGGRAAVGSLRSQSVSQEEVCQWDHVLYVVGQIYAFGLVHG